MRKLVLTFAILGCAVLSSAATLRKPYFAATKPGMCTTYQMSDKASGRSRYEYCREADQGGVQTMKVKVDFETGNYGTTNHYLLKNGYSLEQDGMNYMRAVTKVTMQVPGAAPIEMQPDTIKSMIADTPDYLSTLVYKATENVGDFRCDRYAYKVTRPVSGMTESGEVWLSDQVPFGIVKQTFLSRDKSGKVMSDAEMIYLSHAAAAQPKMATLGKPTGAASSAPRGASMTLGDAFLKGKVRIKVHVVDGVKNGERVQLTLENKEETPLTVVVPKGTTSMEVGMPLGTFMVQSDAEKRIQLGGGASAPAFELKQLGSKRAFEGSFNISVYEGTPLFDGSVTTGFVK